MSEVPIKHFWATPTVELDLSPLTNRIAVLQAEVAALTRERDEARKDAKRLADVIRAALNAPIDLGELAGHSEGDAFCDGYELARTRIEAARTAALSEATP